MNWLDITLVLTFLISIFVGLSEGFTRAGIGFAASILGLLFGLQYYRQVAVSLRPYISSAGTAHLVGFLIIFVGITMLGSVIAGILAKFIREVHLVWLDHAAGALFGAVRGLLFATITIWALMVFLPGLTRIAVSESRLAPVVMSSARRLADASPDEVRDTFRHSYNEMNKILPEKVRERISKAPPATSY